jgi:hypothetical protein
VNVIDKFAQGRNTRREVKVCRWVTVNGTLINTIIAGSQPPHPKRGTAMYYTM